MLIIKIIGGLGNQMFQYAYAKSLCCYGYAVKLDISAFDKYTKHSGFGLNKYKIDLPIATKKEIEIFGAEQFFEKLKKKLHIKNKMIIREKTLLFQSEMMAPQDNSYIEGYFQTEHYFFDIRDILLQQFDIDQSLSPYAQDITAQIKDANVSVSLHVRRGDYIDNAQAKKTHGICSLAYYNEAISVLNEKFKDIKFFIFSDDIAWVKENLKIENSVLVASTDSRLPHEDIYLMSQCHHHIIANSSFSWWGAWLNTKEDKMVIAPKLWFADDKRQAQAKDILPQDWIRL
jgi:hypothetical protein